MRVVELFSTVQGEGGYIGTPSTFLRLGGCNLECAGCDTKWDKWHSLPFSLVKDMIVGKGNFHLVVTGGEPTLYQDELAALLKLCAFDIFTTVESNGSVPIKNRELISLVNLWSFSPKVGSLGSDQHFRWETVYENLHRTKGSHQLKYVLDPYAPCDLQRIQKFHKGVDAMRSVWPVTKDHDVFFQPYDKGTRVNVIKRERPFSEFEGLREFADLVSVVQKAFPHRAFRVLPQLHKFLMFRGQLGEEMVSAARWGG
jgi:7-carboxy-7-deazaguanine synthase